MTGGLNREDAAGKPAVLAAVDRLEMAIGAHSELLGQLVARIAGVCAVELQTGATAEASTEPKPTAPLAADIDRAVAELSEQTAIVQRTLRELEI